MDSASTAFSTTHTHPAHFWLERGADPRARTCPGAPDNCIRGAPRAPRTYQTLLVSLHLLLRPSRAQAGIDAQSGFVKPGCCRSPVPRGNQAAKAGCERETPPSAASARGTPQRLYLLCDAGRKGRRAYARKTPCHIRGKGIKFVPARPRAAGWAGLHLYRSPTPHAPHALTTPRSPATRAVQPTAIKKSLPRARAGAPAESSPDWGQPPPARSLPAAGRAGQGDHALPAALSWAGCARAPQRHASSIQPQTGRRRARLARLGPAHKAGASPPGGCKRRGVVQPLQQVQPPRGPRAGLL